MKKNPDVSIIVVTHDEPKTLDKCLKSIKEQKYPGKIETIVIDNNSKSDPTSVIKKYGFKPVINKENLGLSKALNLGVEISKNDLIITVHGDCVLQSKKWVSNLVKAVEPDDVGAAYSPYIVPFSTWKSYGLVQKLASALDVESFNGRLNDKTDIYKKSVLEKLGFFGSSSFRTAGEDNDLYIKITDLGYKIVKTNDIVFHLHGTKKETFRGYWKKRAQFGEAAGTLLRIHGRKGLSSKWYRILFVFMFFIPPLTIISLAFFTGIISKSIMKAYKKTKDPIVILLFALSFPAFFAWTYGFLRGYIAGKQTM